MEPPDRQVESTKTLGRSTLRAHLEVEIEGEIEKMLLKKEGGKGGILIIGIQGQSIEDTRRTLNNGDLNESLSREWEQLSFLLTNA